MYALHEGPLCVVFEWRPSEGLGELGIRLTWTHQRQHAAHIILGTEAFLSCSSFLSNYGRDISVEEPDAGPQPLVLPLLHGGITRGRLLRG